MGAIFQAAAAQWQQMKSDYDDALEQQYQDAERACNGYMLNRRAMTAGVSSWSLFKGPLTVAMKNASDELIEFWEHTPRLNLSHYERTWLRNRESEHDSYQEYGWSVSRETR